MDCLANSRRSTFVSGGGCGMLIPIVSTIGRNEKSILCVLILCTRNSGPAPVRIKSGSMPAILISEMRMARDSLSIIMTAHLDFLISQAGRMILILGTKFDEHPEQWNSPSVRRFGHMSLSASVSRRQWLSTSMGVPMNFALADPDELKLSCLNLATRTFYLQDFLSHLPDV